MSGRSSPALQKANMIARKIKKKKISSVKDNTHICEEFLKILRVEENILVKKFMYIDGGRSQVFKTSLGEGIGTCEQ
jgi:hypothetical protein